MEEQSFENHLLVAVHSAHEAGKILLQDISSRRRIRYKGEIDLVTDADIKSQRRIVKIIRQKFPDHDFVLEESAFEGCQHNSEYRWIVDPLDGTTNFVHHYPLFSISIALEVRGVIQIGVVFLPVLGELFTAVRGRGAFLNNKKIRVSKTSQIGQSIICTGFPYDIRQRHRLLLQEFKKVVLKARAVRRDGSAAIDLAYTACGRFDGFFERGLKIWDVAAGVVIIQEAGGRISDYHGNAVLQPSEIVATNGKIHGQLVNLLAQSRRK